jgi:hypothetical protein
MSRSTYGDLPGTPWSNLDLFDAHVLDSLLECRAVDRVPISEQIAGRCLPGKRVDDLLRGPLGRGVFRHIEVHDAPAVMGQDDEHKEHPEGYSGHREKIARN